MILSEFIRAVNMGWIELGWGILWAVIIFIICNMIILITLIPAIYDYILKNIMPDLYQGKLKIAENQVKIFKSENTKLIIENRELSDRLKVIKKSVEVYD